MAIAATALWEIRPTVGNDTNGGGFDPAISSPGTDYSQQNSKNTGGSNQSTTDGVGVGSTTITSLTAAFTSALIANIIYFDGNWYTVSAVGSATSITVDRNTTTGTGLTLNIGGALATISQFYTNAIGGQRAYVKASGSYTVTSAQALTMQNGAPITVTGYTTTRGDNGRFTWTTSTNSINLIELGAAYGYAWENVNLSNSAGTPGDCIHAKNSGNSAFMRFRNCKIAGFNVGCNGNYAVDWGILYLVLESCEVSGCVSHGIFNTGCVTLLGCAIHNNGGSGVQMHPASGINCSVFAFATAFKSNTTNGVNYDSSDSASICVLINCDPIDNTAGVNIASGSSAMGLVVWNSIMDSNSTYGLSAAANGNVNLLGLLDNAFRNNGTANYQHLTGDPTDIALSADPFTNAGGSPPDLSLNSTSGGGAACKGAATPQTLPFS